MGNFYDEISRHLEDRKNSERAKADILSKIPDHIMNEAEQNTAAYLEHPEQAIKNKYKLLCEICLVFFKRVPGCTSFEPKTGTVNLQIGETEQKKTTGGVILKLFQHVSILDESQKMWRAINALSDHTLIAVVNDRIEFTFIVTDANTNF